MDETIIYRKVKTTEIEFYHQLRLDCLKNYPQNFGTLYSEELVTTNYKFDKIINQELTNDFLMGAFKNEKLVGICGFIQAKRLKTKHIGEISGMFVSREFSGQKIGTGLLNSTIQIAFDNLEIEQIILTVADKNLSAKNLYKKFNFTEYGKLPNYFKYDGEYETQVLMTLTKNEIKTTNH
ncbi:MAG: GNAT family N-acetyltransferase [Bacteroidetes bacterium]|nr:GNAT family N-acetyltransferase [Bacteroidota bacterium]